MKFAMRSDAGLKGENQDAMAVPPDSVDQSKYGTCLAVADGITLCPKGGELARNAVKVVDIYYKLAEETSPGEAALTAALEELWDTFFDQVEENSDDDYLISGCTLTVALIIDNIIYIKHLGDSHCDILLKDGNSFRLTDEHSTPDGCLINYFGGELQTPAQEESAPFPAGSTVILSTDGVSYFMEIDQMRKIYNKFTDDCKMFVDELFALSDQCGSTDDKTVVVGYPG
ncbi:MAG: protein phosphatase 2C domain-containing protein [Lentisphaeraceae bacterium]|nr:protein phosphatase 2C domain-containing protein [Lentisphaeraceae bacterium]